MRGSGSVVVAAAAGMMVLVVAACGPGQATIPSGAQVVHVVATASVVRLDAASVHAGDVYLQIDEPADGGSFLFVERKAEATDTPGPLTDDDLARLARGDTMGTSISGAGPSCIGPQGAGRGHLAGPGVCGNVFKFAALGPGKYAILGPGWNEQLTELSPAPTAGPQGPVIPATMAVLEVLP
jgi:hypothetical protein